MATSLSSNSKEILPKFYFSMYWFYFMCFWKITPEPLTVLSLINTYNVLFTYNRRQSVSWIRNSFFLATVFNIYSYYVIVFVHQTGIMGAYYLIFTLRCIKNMCIYISLVICVKLFPKYFSFWYLNSKLSGAVSKQNMDGLGYDLYIRFREKCGDNGCALLSLALVDIIEQDFFWSVWSSLWTTLQCHYHFHVTDWNDLNNTMALFLWEYFLSSYFP